MADDRPGGGPAQARGAADGVALPLWAAGPPAGGGSAQGPAAEAAQRPELIPCFAPRGPAGGEAPRAAMVVCPGGGYAGLAPHEGLPVARWLCGLGMDAFVLRYRVAPHRHPAPLRDAQRALRTVRHRAGEWGVDPGRVGILGFSAGGHLAATAGTHGDGGNAAAPDPVERHSSRPDLMVLCYAVLTFGPFRHEGSLHNLLGADPAPALRESLSLETRVRADTPPAFLWHTADDQGVPVENSLLFAMALRRSGVPFALHVFEHGRHGLGLADDDPDVGAWTARCAAWLASRGFGSGGGA